MRKTLLSAAIVAGTCAATVSAALAGPLMLGPTTAPMGVPKTFGIALTSPAVVQTQALNAYRSVRTFWLSRSIVR